MANVSYLMVKRSTSNVWDDDIVIENAGVLCVVLYNLAKPLEVGK